MYLTPWLRSIKSPRRGLRLSSQRALRVQRRSALRVERLEERTLLSVNTVFNPGTNQLTVSSDSNDAITITVASGNVLVNGISAGVAAGTVETIAVSGGPGGNAMAEAVAAAVPVPGPGQGEGEDSGITLQGRGGQLG